MAGFFLPYSCMARKKGALTVIGTGIKAQFHISPESLAAFKNAEKALYVASDTITEGWLRSLQPSAEPLTQFYADGKLRSTSYAEMVEKILTHVRRGSRVCAAFYGHPGIGVHASRESLRIAAREGHATRMLPGISSLDCMFADLGIDPFPLGCQCFEATDFLLHRRIFDPRSPLILWQIGGLANHNYSSSGRYDLRHLPLLQKYLMRQYPRKHSATLYCCSVVSLARPEVITLPISDLQRADIHAGHTLYVPPLKQTSPHPIDVAENKHARRTRRSLSVQTTPPRIK